MEKFTIDSLDKLKFLSDLKLSPRGKYLAFQITESDINDNSYKSKIAILNTETKEKMNLTAKDIIGGLEFLNEDEIIFCSDRENKKDDIDKRKKETKFYKICISGGEAELFMSISKSVKKIYPIDENRFLLIYDFNNLEDSSEDKFKDDYIIVDEFPSKFNGMGYINKKRSRLGIYDKSKDELKEITDEFTNNSSVRLNKDKSKALIISERYEIKTYLKSDLFELDLKNLKLNKILEGIEGLFFADYLEDKIVYLANGNSDYGINANSSLFAIEEGKTKKISGDFDSNFYNSLGTDIRMSVDCSPIVYDSKLYFSSTDVDKINLYSIDLSGDIQMIMPYSGSVDSFIPSDDGIYFIGTEEKRPQEIYLFNEGEYQKLSDFNSFIDDCELSDIETFIFTNDGMEFTGYIIKPLEKNDEKAPGILTIHGGPKTVFGKVLHHEMQLLAAKGYYVFYMNPRGSDGRGNDFMDIRGKYGSIDYDDLMAFTDEVLKLYPQIDEDRLGVMGGSYGGFMTNWIIGHTDRFKAACSQRCISNWTSMYGTSDIGYYFVEDQISGSIWENFDRLWDMSPLKYADKVKTPTLLIHADQDYRCPLEQGEQMFSALNLHGIDTKLVVFKGENHDLSRTGKPVHRKRRLQEILEWMERL